MSDSADEKNDSYVPEFEKSVEHDKSNENIEPKKKRKNCWAVKYSKSTVEGDKKYYRCNRVEARGKQCGAFLYLNLETTYKLQSASVQIYDKP